MKQKTFLTAVLSIFFFYYGSAQFEDAEITAYYTNDVKAEDSTENLRRIEVRVDNLEPDELKGCSVELVDPESGYVIRRKIGRESKKGTMKFVKYDKDLKAYFIDVDYFPQSSKYKVFIRLEDYKSTTSELVTLIIKPYEK